MVAEKQVWTFRLGWKPESFHQNLDARLKREVITRTEILGTFNHETLIGFLDKIDDDKVLHNLQKKELRKLIAERLSTLF